MLSFSTVPYSRYVEMYIGLFFLIPFLNTLYDSFQTRQEKQRLVVVFLFLTAIPGITNGFRAAGVPGKLETVPTHCRHGSGICLQRSVQLLPFLRNAFVSGPWPDYESLLNVLPCVTLFLLFANADYSRLPEAVKTCIARVADWSFGAYLVSWIFGQIFHTRLNAAVASVSMRLEWFPVVVPAVFLCSVGLSALLNGITSRLLKQR